MKLEDAIKTGKFTSEKQKAGLNILYTAWWLKTLISQELKEFGLTHEQYNVLRILKGKHPEKMCVRDIGGRMIERNSNVPRIIDRLVAKKFVDRSTSDIDKRETVITLTTDGMTVLENANKKVDGLFNSTVLMSEENATELNFLLENLRTKE
ncbi:MarR family winged helix-turn-helix transcriptional regulator [Segetibacter aerophilus]|uniref:MarR family transcriptional regulator n=1 Tax=Segetibacter aerophilus TaxID=670293 RepID=A0A512BCD7_9BACT|nr:MarR family transcriptional regulator [Segetibacter aerophilus]GEO09636.1 MarR family transcriptional regulator [Segetibacter aerophilus]